MYRILVALLAYCTLILGAVPIFAAEEHASTNPLSIDPDLAIFTALVFLLLLAVLGKFAWRPIIEGLERRERAIADQIEETRRSTAEANLLLQQYQAKLAESAAEVKEMIAQAHRDADASRDRIVAEARAAAARERDKAVAEINEAKETALREMAQKSVDTAVALAGRIVRRQITDEDHARLIQESLERFPSQN
jgi:F-type H+-transporting ATPase subunit b